MAITKDINRRANVKQKSDGDLPFTITQPILEQEKSESTAAQTVISLGFSVDQANKEIFELHVDGVLLCEGASNDYQFTAIDANNHSSEVTLNAPIASAGLNIIAEKRGLKKQDSSSNDNKLVQLYEMQNEGFNDFIKEELMNPSSSATFPYSSGEYRSEIIGRKAIRDPRLDLGTRFGIERIMVQYLEKIQDEFGPAGESVFKPMNDSSDRIRFVGNWASINDAHGPRQYSGEGSIEITFYGTGLNKLSLIDGNERTVAITVDGAAPVNKTLAPSTSSSVLSSRNYNANHIQPIVSGLTLGVHTVSIVGVAPGAADNPTAGFEILNEATSLLVNPGTSFQSWQKVSSSAQATPAYNSGFDSIQKDGISSLVLGTKGAHCLVYQNTDGSIGKAAVATNSAQANLGSADHSNEEVIRSYHFREFGVGRSDDFSTPRANVLGGDLGFTLDDGITTLMGDEVNVRTDLDPSGGETISCNSNNFIAFTFVGTGLDVELSADGGGRIWSDVQINGVSTAGISGAANSRKFYKVVSGLPYGTHVITFLASGDGGAGISNFITYGPKKPAIPSGAMELESYYLMADFVANTTAGENYIATGTLRKHSTREFTYIGAGHAAFTFMTSPNFSIGGWQVSSAASGDSIKYTFFGTGFEIRGRSNTGHESAMTIDVDGETDFATGSFGAITNSAYGGYSFTASTGILDANNSNANGSGLSLSGFPLGLHTVTMTHGNNAAFPFEALDIITPIHSPASNSPTTVQNALLVGSNALMNLRKFSPLKLEEIGLPNWFRAVAKVTSSTTATTPVPLPGCHGAIKTSGKPISINCDIEWYQNTASTWVLEFWVDGKVEETWAINTPANNAQQHDNFFHKMSLAEGTHFVQVLWYNTSNTLNRSAAILTVSEDK